MEHPEAYAVLIMYIMENLYVLYIVFIYGCSDYGQFTSD